MREILSGLEPLCHTGGRIPKAPEDPQMNSISQIYSNVYGFPLHLKDNGNNELLEQTDDNPAVSLVFNTKMHENENPKAEFARAVYIYPYTNKLSIFFSCTIFLFLFLFLFFG